MYSLATGLWPVSPTPLYTTNAHHVWSRAVGWLTQLSTIHYPINSLQNEFITQWIHHSMNSSPNELSLNNTKMNSINIHWFLAFWYRTWCCLRAYIWLPTINTYVHDVQNSDPKSKQRNMFFLTNLCIPPNRHHLSWKWAFRDVW